MAITYLGPSAQHSRAQIIHISSTITLMHPAVWRDSGRPGRSGPWLLLCSPSSGAGEGPKCLLSRNLLGAAFFFGLRLLVYPHSLFQDDQITKVPQMDATAKRKSRGSNNPPKLVHTNRHSWTKCFPVTG